MGEGSPEGQPFRPPDSRSNRSDILPGRRAIFVAAATFIGLSLLVTFPLVLRLSHSTVEGGLGLNYAVLANAAFIGEQLTQGHEPLRTDRVFFPTGYTLHEGFLPSLLVYLSGAGAERLLGLNISILLSLAAAGFFMYLLAYALTGSQTGSVLAGCYFSFSAFHFGNVGVYPILHIQWIPLFLFGMVALARTGKIRWTFLTAGSFAAAALSSWYFAVFLGIAGICFLVFGWPAFRSWKSIPALGLALGATTGALIPFSPVMLLGDDGLETGGLPLVIDGSADLLSFFTPPLTHWLLYDWSKEIQRDWLGNPSLQANFLGWGSLLLAIAGLTFGVLRHRMVWIVLAICGVLLSLGPFLTVEGPEGWTPSTPAASIDAIRLPYYWILDTFPFSATRAVSRYVLLTLAALSLGLAAIFRKVEAGNRSKRFSRLLAGVCGVVLVFDLWPKWPAPLVDPVKAGPVYGRLAGEAGREGNPAAEAEPTEREQFSVLELPFRNNSYRILYYSTSHPFRVIGGAVDKPFRRFELEIRRYPYFRQLLLAGSPLDRQPAFYGVLGQDAGEYFKGVLREFGVRFAVVHKWDENILSFGTYYVPEPTSARLQEILAPYFDLHAEDHLTYLYAFREPGDDWLYPVIGSNWGALEDHETYADRPLLGSSGTLLIRNSRSRPVDLELDLAVILEPERDLTVSLNGTAIYQGVVVRRKKPGESTRIVIPGVSLARGVSTLEISSNRPVRALSEVSKGSKDQRRISFLLNRCSVRARSASSNGNGVGG